MKVRELTKEFSCQALFLMYSNEIVNQIQCSSNSLDSSFVRSPKSGLVIRKARDWGLRTSDMFYK